MVADAKYDPVDQMLRFDAYSPSLDLVGNYSAQLHFYKNNTCFAGQGLFRISSTEYYVSNVQFPIQYQPRVRKFQMGYPISHEAKVATVDLEITGLKNTLTGEDVELGVPEFVQLTEGHEDAGFMEFWRTIGNYKMKVSQIISLVPSLTLIFTCRITKAAAKSQL